MKVSCTHGLHGRLFIGVGVEKHRIKFIGQEADKKDSTPKIWDILKQGGVTVGIFGSLGSYPRKR